MNPKPQNYMQFISWS